MFDDVAYTINMLTYDHVNRLLFLFSQSEHGSIGDSNFRAKLKLYLGTESFDLSAGTYSTVDKGVTWSRTPHIAPNQMYTPRLTYTSSQSVDAKLSALSVTGVTLDKDFDPHTRSYAGNTSASQVTVTAVANDASATVAYLDGNDMALADADPVATGHQVTISSGANTVKVRVTAADTTFTETYTITLTGVMTTMTLSVTPTTVAEDAGETTLTVTGASDGMAFGAETTVALRVSPGTADAEDFSATTATLTIPANQSSATTTLTFTPTDDMIIEGDETVNVVGVVTGVAATPAQVTITDNDVEAAITVGFVSTFYQFTEGASGPKVELRARTAGNVAPTADFTVVVSSVDGTATAGEDYTALTDTLTFAAADFALDGGRYERTVDVPLTIAADTIVEKTEVFDIGIDTGALPSHVTAPTAVDTTSVDIRDANGAVTVSLSAPAAVDEGDGFDIVISVDKVTSFPFNMTLSPAQQTASAGDDYSTTTKALTFAAGERSKTERFQTVEDRIVEGDEQFDLHLAGVNAPFQLAAANPQATVTITDDDEPTWAVSVDPAAIAEDGGTSTVKVATGAVTFTAAQEIVLTFAGTATKGTDYTVGADTLTLAVGDSVVTTTITAVADTVSDDGETIVVGASLDGTAIGGTATVTFATVPSIATVTMRSAASGQFAGVGGATGAYRIGQSVDVVVTFDAAVRATGSPRLALDFGGSEKLASLEAGDLNTATTTLNFIRTVVTDDVDTNGLSVRADPLRGGTIVAAADGTTPVNRTFAAVGDFAGHLVDGIRPKLDPDTPPATSPDGTTITLTFDEDLATVAEALPPNTRFSVTAGGTAVGLGTTAPALSGRTVTLTLASAVAYGQTVVVTYTDEGAGDNTAVVQDAIGNDALGFVTGQGDAPAVVNNVPHSLGPLPSTFPANETLIWSATLGTAATTTSLGFLEAVSGVRPQVGSLSPTTFTYDGENYEFSQLVQQVQSDAQSDLVLLFRVGSEGSIDDERFRHRLKLYIGAQALNFADAVHTTVARSGVTWPNIDFTMAGSSTYPVAITIDTSAPTVDSVSVSAPRAGQRGFFAIGNAITATITFNRDVEVIGTPKLEMQIGANARSVNCTASSTDDKAVDCAYTVAAGDADDNGIEILANKLTVTASDSIVGKPDSTAADLSHSAVAADTARKVDGVRPTLVTTGDDAPRTTGDGARIILTFSEQIHGGDLNYTVKVSGTAIAKGGTETFAGSRMDIPLPTAITSDTVTVTVELAAGAVQDAATNQNDATGEQSVSVSLSSTDATLSNLVVNDGTNNVALVPTFDPDTTTYTATVANTVTRVTVTPTLNHSSATLQGYRDALTGGNTLTDADPNTDGFQVDLDVGENPIAVFVLAEDAVTGGGYIVTVTREGPPTITAVALTSTPPANQDDTYKIGDAIEATLTFTEAVDVDTTGGVPTVRIDIAATAATSLFRSARYVSGTGTTELVFAYTVVETDPETRGVRLTGNGLTLNGGTIKRAGGTTNADLFYALADIQNTHKVDGVRPALVTTGDDAPHTSTHGTTITMNFSEGLGSAGAATDLLVTVDGDTVATGAPVISGSKAEITLTTPLTDPEATVTLAFLAEAAVRDSVGNGVKPNPTTPVAVVNRFVPPPAVDSVWFPQNLTNRDALAIGDQVLAEVTFDAPVKPQGSPTLKLNVGGTQETANLDPSHSDGAATTTVRFFYTVVENDEDTDGVSIDANSLTGPMIVSDADGRPASLDHVAVPDSLGPKVDGIRPAWDTNVTPAVPADGTKVIVTLTEAILSVDRSKISITVGSATVRPSASTISDKTVELRLPAGNVVTSSTTTVSVRWDAAAFRDLNRNFSAAQGAITVTNGVAAWALTLSGGESVDADGNGTIKEGGADMTVRVTITNGVRFDTHQRVRLIWAGQAWGDLVHVAGGNPNITIAANDSTGTLTLEAPDDDTAHGFPVYIPPVALQLLARLGGDTGPVIDDTKLLTWVDNEPVPEVTISAAAAEVTEGEGIRITATPSPVPGVITSIRMSVTGGTGVLSGTPPPAIVHDGESASASLTIPTDDDMTAEAPSTVTIALALNADHPWYTLGDPSSVTVTVKDNDTPPGAPRNFAASPGGGSAALTWDAPASDGGQPILKYRYRYREGASGTWTAWADVPLSGDGEANRNGYRVTGLTGGVEHAFELVAANVAGDGTAASATATPTTGIAVSFEDARSESRERGTFAVTVTLGQAPTAPVVIPLTSTPGPGLEANEYGTVPASLTFGVNETARSFSVPHFSDDVDEADETLTLGFGDLPDGYALGTNPEKVLTILDDDLTVAFGAERASVPEGGEIEVTVRLSEEERFGLRIGIAVARGSGLGSAEYSGVPDRVEFAVGESEKRFTVSFEDDTAVESDETLTLRFGARPNRAAVGTPSEMILTVEDDDGPPGPPTNVSATGANQVVILSWGPPPPNDSPVLEYAYRWRAAGGGFGTWRTTTDTSDNVTQLTNGTEYVFQVRARNQHGWGEAAEVRATPAERQVAIPTAPQELRVLSEDARRPELRWIAPSNAIYSDSESVLQGYGVAVCTADCGDEANWSTLVANTGTVESRWTEAGLALGAVRGRAYRVRAININGRAGPWSNRAALEPTEMDRLRGRALDDDKIRVTWQVDNPDGREATLTIHRSGDPQADRQEAAVRPPTTGENAHTFEGLAASTQYRIELSYFPTDDDDAQLLTARETTNDAGTLTPGQGLPVLDISGARLDLRMGGTASYRVRLKACEGERLVRVDHHGANMGSVIAGGIPTEVTPNRFVLRCGGADRPGPWESVTVRAKAGSEYRSATHLNRALMQTPFDDLYGHTVYRDGTDAKAALTHRTGWVTITLDAPLNGLRTPGSLTGTRHSVHPGEVLFTWDGVPGAATYDIQWRQEGDRYDSKPFSGGLAKGRRTGTDTSRWLDRLDPNLPLTVRVRARSATGAGEWRERRYNRMADIPQQQPTFSVADAEAHESGDGSDSDMTFTVTLDPAPPGPQSAWVDYRTEDRTQGNGIAKRRVDYKPTNGRLQFQPGETEHLVTVKIIDDEIEDDRETFIFRLTRAGEAVIGDGEAVGTIRNTEGGHAPARLSRLVLVDAAAGTDLAALTDSATLDLDNPEAGSFTVRADPVEDAAIGSVKLELSGGSTASRTTNEAPYTLHGSGGTPLPAGGYTLTATVYAEANATGDVIQTLSASFTIAATGQTPSVSVADASATEGSAVAFSVSLSAASSSQVTVAYATAAGTAAAGGDFTAAAGTLTFAANETEKTLSVATADDSADEEDETFTLTLSSPAGATLADSVATGTILDDDDPPAVSVADASATEGDAIEFTVALSEASGRQVTVAYATAAGTAAEDDDFTAASGTLTFEAGETEKTVSVATADDSDDEQNETFTLTLSSPTNATLGDGTATGTIVDDDDAPTPTVSVADASATEGDAVEFTVSLSAASSSQVTVAYATSDGTAAEGDDFTAASGTLTFDANETEKTVSVSTVDDDDDEENETFTLTLSSPTNATLGDAEATGTIVDDDDAATPLTASFSGMPASHTGAAFTFGLEFSEEPDVGYETLRDDAFQVTGGDVTRAQRQQQGSNLAWNITVEPSGNADVTITLPETTDCTADGAICTGDDRPLSHSLSATVDGPTVTPSLSVADASATEGGAVEFTVTLSPASASQVTVDYATSGGTATSGTDFTAASGTLTFAANETSQTVSVATTDDDDDEENETFTLTLSSPAGATLGDATATGTIVDDDEAPTPTVSVADGSATEGSAVDFTVSLSVASSSQVTVAYATSGGTATSGTDFTAASGTLTFAANETSQTVSVATTDDSDDEENETFTLTLSSPAGATLGDATATGTIVDDDEAATPLTARFTDMPASHTGAEFTFGLTFSEDFDLSYQTLRDEAFTVTGGDVRRARRQQQGSNQAWTIHVEPASATDTVKITLPETTDCNATGAICTGDGRPLSHSLSATVVPASASADDQTQGNIMNEETDTAEALAILDGVTPEEATAALLGEGTLSEAQRAALDRLGNRNDRFDLGDVRSWIDRCRRGEASCGTNPTGSGPASSAGLLFGLAAVGGRGIPGRRRRRDSGRRGRLAGRALVPMLGAAMTWSCTGDLTGPAADPVVEEVPVAAAVADPGFVTVEWAGPAGGAAIAVLLELEGPGIEKVRAPGLELYQSSEPGPHRIIVLGSLRAGPLVQFRVPDRNRMPVYGVRVVEVTGEDYGLRDPKAYRAVITN